MSVRLILEVAVLQCLICTLMCAEPCSEHDGELAELHM